MASEAIERAPVRYSIHQTGYDPDLGQRIHVTFNGQGIREVIAYDTEAGTIELYVTDARGNLVYDRATGIIQTHTLRGKVEASLARVS